MSNLSKLSVKYEHTSQFVSVASLMDGADPGRQMGQRKECLFSREAEVEEEGEEVEEQEEEERLRFVPLHLGCLLSDILSCHRQLFRQCTRGAKTLDY